jgi:hypothetical protein
MLFISRHTSAELSLTTPPDFCCNCGAHGELEFVETPLKKVRYFLMFGTELTLTEFFPYCVKCRKTATRIRQGWMAKALTACLVTAVLFLVFVLTAGSLPRMLSENLFRSAVLVAILLTAAYFYAQEWGRTGRTYYQPVSLVDARIDGDRIDQFKLKFYNPGYGAVVKKANPELIRSGLLKVEASDPA